MRVDVHVPLARRRRVARAAERAAHEDVAREQVRERGLPLQRDGEIRERPERHEGDLAGPRSSDRDDPVRGVVTLERAARRGQVRVADPARPVRLGRRLERLHERLLAPERHGHVRPTGQGQDGARVLGDAPRVHVPADARHPDELDLGRGTRVQEREGVVDAGVDIEEQGDLGWHRPES